MSAIDTFEKNVFAEQPMWLFSNLSFCPSALALNFISSFLSSNDGINMVHFVNGPIDIEQMSSCSWGLIPFFGCNERQVDLFFAEIFESRAPLLTLWIDEPEEKIDHSQAAPAPYVQFGKVMSSDQFDSFSSALELKTHVLSKLNFFELARMSSSKSVPNLQDGRFTQHYDWTEIAQELDMLDEQGCRILRRGRFCLYLTTFKSLNVIPIEIGRLRAETFQEIGEGTGLSIDLDQYDKYYNQLFLVDTEAEQIVGGYRIGCCDDIMTNYGLQGLYTHSLYAINSEAVPFLSSSVELGRSFIVASYQKKHLPLFLLWNGILHFLQSRKRYKYIIGLVSISRVFSDISRSLIISYLKMHHFDSLRAQLFRPRQAFFSTSSEDKLSTFIKVFNGELIHLDEFISEIEPGNNRLPVLIRKYLNQNAHFIGFNLDPAFSSCVDGLMVLDINELPKSTKEFLQGHVK